VLPLPGDKLGHFFLAFVVGLELGRHFWCAQKYVWRAAPCKKSPNVLDGTILEILVVKGFCQLLPLNSAVKMGLVRGGVDGVAGSGWGAV
jgi:hypothetical protein